MKCCSFLALVRKGAFLLPLVGFVIVIFIDVLGPWLFLGSDSVPDENAASALIRTFKWDNPQTVPRAAVRDRTARSVLEMANLLLISASVYVAFRSLGAIVTRSQVTSAKWWYTTILAVVAMTLCIVLIDSNLNLFWVNSVPQRLFAYACQLTGAARLATMSYFTQIMMQVTMVVVGMHVCLILAQPSIDANDLGTQMDDLRVLLNHAATVLVLYSMEAATEMLWPAALLSPGDGKTLTEGDFVQKLALGVSLSAGVYNVILLAFIFGPALWELTSRVREVASDVPDMEQRRKLLENHGLISTPAQYLTRLFSVISPLLAGLPLAQVLSFLLR